ncbi:hypothetical protein SLEP1_g34719 [Rubroshorea leprosula]|uniref:Uncharacterized protein n=1 Tax=Rubroshorea leprosula TaxID=152421 RepID=A0AAV5KL79_9ROSI|nr:hypothetical protein SLEP1_g34719 [Rubroshorea leprosula]
MVHVQPFSIAVNGVSKAYQDGEALILSMVRDVSLEPLCGMLSNASTRSCFFSFED